MTEHCRFERHERLLTVTIDRPTVRNALHPQACRELASVFDDFEADPDLWVAILTGSGDKAFCAGKDLKHAREHGESPEPESGFGGLTSRHRCTKPILAAVNGAALGGGFEIALACDIVVADENAVFALPEPRVGLAALAGGLHRLPRQVPLKQAMGMILTGRPIGARDGFVMGFVNEVAPSGQAMRVAREWASDILKCAPLSISASKQAVMQGLRLPSLSEAMHRRYEAVECMLASMDTSEGLDAFCAKREPRWSGV